MNIEQWLDMYSFDIDGEGKCVDVSDLRDLLKTHVIVPREPSDTMVNSARNKYYYTSSCVARGIYSKMITESENEQ